jgi:hypothetical protein
MLFLYYYHVCLFIVMWIGASMKIISFNLVEEGNGSKGL